MPRRERAEPFPGAREGALARASAPVGSVLPDPLMLACFVIAVVGAATATAPLALVGAVVLAVVVFSRLWSRLSLERVRVHRGFARDRVFRGDEIQLDIVIENRKPLPLPWLRLGFVLPDGLRLRAADPGRELDPGGALYETFSLGRYERVRVARTVVARHRGCFRLGTAHVESGDLFGFYTSRAESTSRHHELVVYPLPRALPGFTLPARAPEGELGERRWLHEDCSRPSGTREYRPGDPLRRMDWKSTARRRRPYVRTFDPSRRQLVIVLLECATGEQLWRYRPERLEAAVAAAATVCVTGIEAGHQVGLVANGVAPGAGGPVVPPGAGPRQLETLLGNLARVQPLPAGTLERLYEAHASGAIRRPREATLVYVTARARAETLGMLARLCRQGAVATCVYVGGEMRPKADFMTVHDFSAEPGEAGAQETPGGGASAVLRA